MADDLLAALAKEIETTETANKTILFRDGLGGAKSMTLDDMLSSYGSIEQVSTVPWAFNGGEPEEVPVYAVKVASPEDSKAQEDRAKKYGIAVKDSGSVTVPGKWGSATDGDFADPVNYKYFLGDKTHVQNALSRWGDPDNRQGYSADEQDVIEKRLKAAAQKYDVETTLGEKAAESKEADAKPAEKAAPTLVACPNPDCKGKVPVGASKCPTCGKTLNWQGDTPSLAEPTTSGKPVEKTLTVDGHEISVKTETDSILCTVKSSEPAVEQVVVVEDSIYTVRAPSSLGAVERAKYAQQIHDQLHGQKDWDDDTVSAYAPVADTGDPDDDVWAAFDALWDMTLDGIDAVDDLAKAQSTDGDGGISRDDVLAMLNQHVNACMVKFDAMDTQGQKDIKGFITKMADVAPAIHALIVEKAGMRHSTSDQQKITAIHDTAVDLGYDGCVPKAQMGTKTTDGLSELQTVNEKAALVSSDLEREKEARATAEKSLLERETALERANAELAAIRANRKPVPDKTRESAPPAPRRRAEKGGIVSSTKDLLDQLED